jgi:hypothetical protein
VTETLTEGGRGRGMKRERETGEEGRDRGGPGGGEGGIEARGGEVQVVGRARRWGKGPGGGARENAEGVK